MHSIHIMCAAMSIVPLQSVLSEKSVVIFYAPGLLYDVYDYIHFKCPHCFDSEGDQRVFFSSSSFSYLSFFSPYFFFCSMLPTFRHSAPKSQCSSNGIHSLCDDRKENEQKKRETKPNSKINEMG